MEIKKYIRVALYQQTPGGGVYKRDLEKIKSAQPDFFSLPEYFFPAVGPDGKPGDHKKNLEYLKSLSIETGSAVVGGTMVVPDNGKLYNTAYLIDNGEVITSYRKIHLFERENEFISPGQDYVVAECRGYRIGILICADVLHQESFKKMKELDPDIIFIPTFSPYRAGETKKEKFKRDNDIFVKGANLCNCYIVKTCSKGSYNGRRLQGRSLIASPEKIIARIPPSQEDRKMILIRDIIPSRYKTRV